MAKRSIRDELRTLYVDSRASYEDGFVAAHRHSYRIAYNGRQSACYEAYRAGWDAGNAGRPSTMPDDVFLRVLVEWCK